MSETTNYKLYISDDAMEKFLDWRKKLAGESDSNMVKIDSALKSMDDTKAIKSRSVEAKLTSGGWVGANAPFTQTINIDGLLQEQNGVINISQNATAVQRVSAREAMLSIIEQTNGTITIAADGKIPETDIPVCIILLD